MTAGERMAKFRAGRPPRREVILSPEADERAEALMLERGVGWKGLVEELILDVKP